MGLMDELVAQFQDISDGLKEAKRKLLAEFETCSQPSATSATQITHPLTQGFIAALERRPVAEEGPLGQEGQDAKASPVVAAEAAPAVPGEEDRKATGRGWGNAFCPC